MGHPVEFAAVDDTAADGTAVAVHILGGGVGDDIRAPLDGPAVDRGGEGVVDNQRDAVAMRGIREQLNIQDGQRGVGDGFAENGLGVRPERRVQLFRRAVGGDEGEIHAHFLHGDGEEVVGAAVDGGGGDHMIAGSGDIENGEEVCGLAGGGQHRGGTALESADLRGDIIVGRILETGVEITGGLQVKELAHILARIVLESGGLDDRDLAGFSVPRGVPGLNAKRFNVRHGFVLL